MEKNMILAVTGSIVALISTVLSGYYLQKDIFWATVWIIGAVVFAAPISLRRAFLAGREPVRKLKIGTYYLTLAKTKAGDTKVPSGFFAVLRSYTPDGINVYPFFAHFEKEPMDDFYVDQIPAKPKETIFVKTPEFDPKSSKSLSV